MAGATLGFKNAAGLEVYNGHDLTNDHTSFYCGRAYCAFQSCACGHCDGNCGPHRGCPCPECSDFKPSSVAASLDVPESVHLGSIPLGSLLQMANKSESTRAPFASPPTLPTQQDTTDTAPSGGVSSLVAAQKALADAINGMAKRRYPSLSPVEISSGRRSVTWTTPLCNHPSVAAFMAESGLCSLTAATMVPANVIHAVRTVRKPMCAQPWSCDRWLRAYRVAVDDATATISPNTPLPLAAIQGSKALEMALRLYLGASRATEAASMIALHFERSPVIVACAYEMLCAVPPGMRSDRQWTHFEAALQKFYFGDNLQGLSALAAKEPSRMRALLDALFTTTAVHAPPSAVQQQLRVMVIDVLGESAAAFATVVSRLVADGAVATALNALTGAKEIGRQITLESFCGVSSLPGNILHAIARRQAGEPRLDRGSAWEQLGFCSGTSGKSGQTCIVCATCNGAVCVSCATQCHASRGHVVEWMHDARIFGGFAETEWVGCSCSVDGTHFHLNCADEPLPETLEAYSNLGQTLFALPRDMNSTNALFYELDECGHTPFAHALATGCIVYAGSLLRLMASCEGVNLDALVTREDIAGNNILHILMSNAGLVCAHSAEAAALDAIAMSFLASPDLSSVRETALRSRNNARLNPFGVLVTCLEAAPHHDDDNLQWPSSEQLERYGIAAACARSFADSAMAPGCVDALVKQLAHSRRPTFVRQFASQLAEQATPAVRNAFAASAVRLYVAYHLDIHGDQQQQPPLRSPHMAAPVLRDMFASDPTSAMRELGASARAILVTMMNRTSGSLGLRTNVVTDSMDLLTRVSLRKRVPTLALSFDAQECIHSTTAILSAPVPSPEAQTTETLLGQIFFSTVKLACSFLSSVRHSGANFNLQNACEPLAAAVHDCWSLIVTTLDRMEADMRATYRFGESTLFNDTLNLGDHLYGLLRAQGGSPLGFQVVNTNLPHIAHLANTCFHVTRYCETVAAMVGVPRSSCIVPAVNREGAREAREAVEAMEGVEFGLPHAQQAPVDARHLAVMSDPFFICPNAVHAGGTSEWPILARARDLLAESSFVSSKSNVVRSVGSVLGRNVDDVVAPNAHGRTPIAPPLRRETFARWPLALSALANSLSLDQISAEGTLLSAHISTEAKFADVRESLSRSSGPSIHVQADRSVPLLSLDFTMATGVRLVSAHFANEAGSGAGVNRGWFSTVGHALLAAPSSEREAQHIGSLVSHGALFVPSEVHGTFIPRHVGQDQWQPKLRDAFTHVGKFLALAIANGAVVPLVLARPVILHLLGRPLRLTDLAHYSPQRYDTLCALLSMGAEELDGLGLTFVVSHSEVEGAGVTDLLEGTGVAGSEVDVTRDNVHEYVRLHAQLLMVGRSQHALDAMKQGFASVFNPTTTLALLSPLEVTQLLCGVAELSAETLLSTCVVQAAHGISDTNLRRFNVMFGQCIDRMSVDQRSALVYFCTGSHSVSDSMQISVSVVECSHSQGGSCAIGACTHLPTASVCGNQIRIPLYANADVLFDKLVKASSETLSYEFA